MSAKVCFIVLCDKYTQDVHNVNAGCTHAVFACEQHCSME